MTKTPKGVIPLSPDISRNGIAGRQVMLTGQLRRPDVFDSVFHLSSPERAKRVAKSLADALKARGVVGFPYSKCQELVARMYGHRTHKDLLDDCGKHPPSQDDAVAGEEAAAARHERHLAVLTAAGVVGATAEDVLDAVAPTRRADPRKASTFEPFADELGVGLWLPSVLFAREMEARTLTHESDPSRLRKAMRGGLLLMEQQYARTRPQDLLCAIGDLVEIHERGMTPDDLRNAFLHQLVREFSDDFVGVHGREWIDSSAKTLKRRDNMRAFLSELADSWYPVALPKFTHDLAVLALDSSNVFDDAKEMFWESLSDAKRFVKTVCYELFSMNAFGVTCADMAMWIVERDKLGERRLDRLLPGDLIATMHEDHAESVPLPESARVEAAVGKAVAVAMGRGIPRPLSANGYFAATVREYSFLRSDGHRIFASDALVAAEEVGFGLRELVAAALKMADHAATYVDFADRSSRMSWDAAIQRMRSARGTAEAMPRDLLMAGYAYFHPDWNAGPDLFEAAVVEIEALADAGIRPVDVVAASWIARGPTLIGMNVLPRRGPDKDSYHGRGPTTGMTCPASLPFVDR